MITVSMLLLIEKDAIGKKKLGIAEANKEAVKESN